MEEGDVDSGLAAQVMVARAVDHRVEVAVDVVEM